MLANNDFDHRWYESTYPHSILEQQKLGLPSLQDHYVRVGDQAGWYPSPFALPRSPGGRHKTKLASSALFPKNVFNFFATTEKYLYQSQPGQVALAITQAWHRRVDKTVSYFEIAANESGDEPHFILHAALEYCQSRQFARAQKIISRINRDITLSEYHLLLLCAVYNLLGSKSDVTRVATEYLSKYPSRVFFLGETIPDLRFCRNRRTAVFGFRFILFSLFSYKSRSTIFIDGQEVVDAFGEPKISLFNALQHLGPSSSSCDVYFSALLDIKAPLAAASDITVEIFNETTRFNGQVDTFNVKTNVTVIDDLFPKQSDIPVRVGHLIRP